MQNGVHTATDTAAYAARELRRAEKIECLYLLASGFTDILEKHASAAVQTE